MGLAHVCRNLPWLENDLVIPQPHRHSPFCPFSLDFSPRIMRLQDELVTLRLECTNLYRKGHFSSPSSLDFVQPSSLSTRHLKAEPLLKETHTTAITASTSWFRKPMTRAELVAISSSEDEGNLRFVYELLSWVEEMQVCCLMLNKT